MTPLSPEAVAETEKVYAAYREELQALELEQEAIIGELVEALTEADQEQLRANLKNL